MKPVTKLNPDTCPQTIAHLRKAISQCEKDFKFTVFKGLAYAELDGEIWHIATDARTEPPFKNDWTDESFGFLKNSDFTISLLPHPEHCGDWHDKPLRYSVQGPANEIQKFSTKKEAIRYRSIRRQSATQHEAIRAF